MAVAETTVETSVTTTTNSLSQDYTNLGPLTQLQHACAKALHVEIIIQCRKDDIITKHIITSSKYT